MRRTAAAALAGIGLLAGFAGTVGRGDASSRGDRPSGVLLFADSRGSPTTGVGEGVPGLYRIDADGTSRRPLRGHFYVGDAPDWSPDGRQLVFSRWLATEDSRSIRDGLDIVVAAANGTAAHVLVEHTDAWSWPTNAEWSADGRHIAYVSRGPSAVRIFVTGTKPVPFEIGRGVRGSDGAQSVTWSPAGDELAFDRGDDVYRIPVKGGTPRLLVRHAHDPAWSPDGRKIAYVADRGGVYVLDLPTRRSRPVTHSCRDASPAWSPDGSRLAFADCGHPTDPSLLDQSRHDLVVVKANGSGRRIIFTSDAGISSPSWR